jgi:hypothetical protein
VLTRDEVIQRLYDSDSDEQEFDQYYPDSDAESVRSDTVDSCSSSSSNESELDRPTSVQNSGGRGKRTTNKGRPRPTGDGGDAQGLGDGWNKTFVPQDLDVQFDNTNVC